MLQQGIVKIGESIAFIDKFSDKCIDGKECDSNGCLVYDFKDGRIYERDFKEYRKFSPQFRRHLIEENLRSQEIRIRSCSASCSKCGTASIDKAMWF